MVTAVGNLPLVLAALLRACHAGCGPPYQGPVGNLEFSVLGLVWAAGCFAFGYGTYLLLGWLLDRWGWVGKLVAMVGPIGWTSVSFYGVGVVVMSAVC